MPSPCFELSLVWEVPQRVSLFLQCFVLMKSGFYFLCRRNCSGKSLLLQQLRAAREKALELLHKVSVPAEKLHPERLKDRGSSPISQNQSCEVRQETNEVVPRKLRRLEPGKESPPFSSCGGNDADTEKENKMEAEEIQNAGNAPECPLITAQLPRYPTRKVISRFGCGFSNCPGLQNIALPGLWLGARGCLVLLPGKNNSPGSYCWKG